MIYIFHMFKFIKGNMRTFRSLIDDIKKRPILNF